MAVWDVLYDCERKGSLDNNIQRDSEVPNDLAALLSDHPSINTVAFNGKAAGQIFTRHFPDFAVDFEQIVCVDLPSTSPAHASLSREQKARIWSDQLALPIPNIA